MLACVALANMGAVAPPPAIGTVIPRADNEAGNPKAADGLQRAIAAHEARGRTARLAQPAVPGADWNDILPAYDLAA